MTSSCHRHNNLVLSIDTLSDGSESTGDACLFLTVSNTSCTFAARYLLTGFGTDGFARLAADQRYKLGSTRAVFCPTSGGNCYSLPSLLLALSALGSDKLSIVTTVSDPIEATVELVGRKYPQARICTVSTPTTAAATTWWNVYEEEYLLVHASVDNGSGTDTSVLYVYTIGELSFLVLPPGCASMPKVLPVLKDGETPLELDFYIQLEAQQAASHDNLRSFFTRASVSCDANLLVRAQQQSRAWHEMDHVHFSWQNHQQQEPQTTMHANRLCTGTSLLLHDFTTIDRLEELKNHEMDLERRVWPSRYSFGLLPVDNNEIELEDDDDDIDTETTATATIDLLVLGTGCAAPSPYRGASGYAILFKSLRALVFEVGEGFVCQWYRYTHRLLTDICAIWISHAHWDHYGGLLPLLVTLHDLQTQHQQERTTTTTASSESKRQRVEKLPPIVIAPDKVLKYLEIHLKEKQSLYYRPFCLPRQSQQASEALCALKDINGNKLFSFFKSIPVHHSCHHAFGFVMGLQLRNSGGSPFVFCFSGDTLPCRRLVDASRQLARQYSGGCVDFLLHEATFDETEARMSFEKKHSTVHQALQVARDIKPQRIFLTHFSQRYNSPPALDTKSKVTWTPTFDGLRVPLFS
jgi:ribonuclease BN (tRNA processing enzyme)